MHFFSWIKNFCKQQKAMRYGVAVLTGCLFYVAPLSSQITTTGGLTAQQLVQSIMGKGYTVSNAVLNCPAGASGSFISTTSNIGMKQGIVLTTGSINDVNGPNNDLGVSVDN